MISPARLTAFDILLDVEGGGYASELLTARCAALAARDAGLAQQIVMGVLRTRRSSITSPVRAQARPGSARGHCAWASSNSATSNSFHPTPPSSESVELVKRARKRSAAGLVNAVLRRITRDPVEWPSREIALSCPEWLLARWEGHYGREAAERIARAALEEPEHYVRAPGGGEGLEPTAVPGCYRVIDGDAGCRTQDIGSQSIVPLLSLESGQTFLDVCAAPGGKTAQALEAGVRAVAADVHLHRLAQLKGMGARSRCFSTAPVPSPSANRSTASWWTPRAPAPAPSRAIPRSSGG